MVSKIARIINGEIVYSDKSAEVIKPHDMASRSRREAMKVKHRKDLLQKNQELLERYRQHQTAPE